ncbi:hypothetical protein BBH88_07345 [Planococcus antarcticus DSM 14505]|uniref:SLH domain-containing protein n=1 Tax=Planococcus antarcticus DSM 14505 TaxID=1185653 RepID=A0ABM6D3G6_9BACL|nr:Ig-like domain-containing protein [Planococcus antarcticus]ANU10129.1 hypothetical protein BBH88_07345 [Planococcus antarcticus DSM 14505]
MKKSMKVSSVLLSVVLLSSTLGTTVYAEEEKPLVTQEVETDQVIVTFKEDTTSEMTDLDVVSVKTVDTEEIATLKVPEGETVNTYIEELEARKDIESVEPDHLVQLTYTPNDPYFNYYQYHHKNIETERAWDKTMGSSDVVVAVLDSGFDINHPDLKEQIVKPHTTADSGFSVDDHGTHVAGIIGSSIDNYEFGAGVAPKTSIMPIDVFVGETAYTSDVIEGIYQAVWAGADIINMSLGSYNYSTQYNNAIQYAYQSGLVIIASAGNDATSRTHYPSAYDNVISVGSTDSSDYQSYFSNYGYDVDVVAPGSSIYSILPYGSGGWMSGTSMASPVVAGVAALVMANEPNLTNTEVVDRLLSTAKDLGDYGRDYIYGNGLVNAKQAVKVIDIPAPVVDPIQDYATTVRGFLPFYIDNGKIMIRNESGNVIGSAEGYSSYSVFEVPISKQTAGTKLYISVVDSYNNESEALEVIVSDNTAPEKPEVHEVTDQSTSIIGSAEPNTVLTVLANDSIIDTAWVDGNGNFERPIVPFAAGTKLSLNVMDDAGNISEPADLIVKDATAPAKPKVNGVTENAVKVTGTAEANSLVTVKVKGVLLGEATTAANGSYSVVIVKQKAGTLLAINSTDQSGNVSETTEIKVKDTTAPALPTVAEVTDKSTTVKGTAEAGSIIVVKAGATEIGKAKANADGGFATTIAKQKAGTKLSVTATDASGNVSPSKDVTVLDATAPLIPTVDKVTDKSIAVTGTGEIASFISIKSEGKELGAGTVDGDGKYKVAIAAQKAGTKIQVTSMDVGGNISSVKETVVLEAAAPDMPTVNKVTDQSTVVTGTAEATSKIIVKVGSKQVGTTTASAVGTYSADISKQKAGTVIAITAVDKEGNTSEAKEVIVVDGTAPALKLKNKVTHYSTRIIGTAEADAKIEVKAGTKSIGTATTDAKGTYEVTIAKQKIGTKISITATDAAGNSSKAIPVTVVDGNYPDLKLTHWALDKIMYLADDQIIGGYPNGSFQPEKNTTRAEAAKMLALALDLPVKDVPSGYKDVSNKHWGKDYIAAVSKAGLFTGNPDGTFAPNDVLKRAEMAKVISIAYKLNASDKNHFSDVKAGHWAKGYISGLYENGITTGYPDKTFHPGEPTTRAEYSVFLARAMNEDFR